MDKKNASFQRTAVFVDGGYLDSILDHAGKPFISYGKMKTGLAEMAGEKLALLRAYYYHCAPYEAPHLSSIDKERNMRKNAFFSALKRYGFTVRLGDLEYRGRDNAGELMFQQKGVDIALATDLLNLSIKGLITHAVIVTGDSDYVPVIDAVKNEGVHVTVAHGKFAHDRLVEVADATVLLAPILQNWADDKRINAR
jgi:uncharacterized LabA/DUF88 family protein